MPPPLMTHIYSFAPLTTPSAQILILGTMPGEVSLAKSEYYAHPRNAFWPIMGHIGGFDPALPYAERVEKLLVQRIAVWDVLQGCVRPGSLDADIERETAVPNDFASFWAVHPRLRRVCFNGATAEQLFRKQVWGMLPDTAVRVDYVRLPSTSPANARLSFAQKLAVWQAALSLA